MSETATYQALYRKLRPRVFADVIGQEPVVRTLLNQMASGRVSHAYLFCGTRGTGKTSTAKIFSRAVNCERPVNGEPCNTCRTCENILHNRSMNVLEIDAASNNGVENIRDIREEVVYPPTEGHYKVYIIDEVHMLSTGAFNALLKTLEEPPEHVIFILATTDPQKIPATIHSRCQRFDFKRIPVALMAETLKAYTDTEKIQIAPEALRYICGVSDGALRDAQSILEQCISFYYGEPITMEKVLELLGAVDTSVFFAMTEALAGGDSLRCIQLIDEMVLNGRDIGQYVGEQLNHFRNVLVAGAGGADGITLNTTEDNARRLLAQSKQIGKDLLMTFIRGFSQLQGSLRYAPGERVLLEVTCLKLCDPPEEIQYDSVVLRLNQMEQKLREGIAIAPLNGGASPTPPPEKKKKKTELKKRRAPEPEDVQRIKAEWADFTGQGIGLEGVAANYLKEATLAGENQSLYILSKHKLYAEKLETKQAVIQAALQKRFDVDMPLIFMTAAEFEQRFGIESAPETDLLEETAKFVDLESLECED